MMNQRTTKSLAILNLAFWAVAIALPYIVQLLPTASGSPPKIMEVFVPLFQIMLACAATRLLTSAAAKPE